MKEASLDASHRIGKAISSASAQRPSNEGAAPLLLSSSRLMPRASARPHVHGVQVEPGQTALTRMPCGASSHASTRVKASTAALLASYAPMLARPASANTEETLTMLPLPDLRKCGNAARAHIASPVTLVCRIVAQLSGVASASGPNARAAALLTRMSSAPSSAASSAVAAVISSGLAISAHRQQITAPGISAARSAAALPSVARSLSIIPSRAPSRANNLAAAYPMPRAAPVMIAAFCESRPGMG